MTSKADCTQFNLVMELLIKNDFDGIVETLSVLMNSTIQVKRSRHVNAEPYE